MDREEVRDRVVNEGQAQSHERLKKESRMSKRGQRRMTTVINEPDRSSLQGTESSHKTLKTSGNNQS